MWIFGSGTETGLMWYQFDNGLEPNGAVDDLTARLLGFLPSLKEGDTAPAADTATPTTVKPKDNTAQGAENAKPEQASDDPVEGISD